jgi:hypothetical protein
MAVVNYDPKDMLHSKGLLTDKLTKELVRRCDC